MSTLPNQLIALVPGLPLLVALVVAVLHVAGPARGEAGERLTARLSLGAITLACLLLAALGVQALWLGMPHQIVLGQWFAGGSGSDAWQLPVSFTLDGLSLGFAAVTAFIAWATLRFSVNYMHREAGFHRFFIGMNLFVGGMLLLTLAGHSGAVFVAWEMMGLSSWMLIGYAFDRPTATANAQRAFLSNRVGDAGLLLGLALSLLWLGGLDWPALEAGAAQLPTLQGSLLALGFVTAALVKSAQIPFTPWITRALEGPTPSSAIFYGAVMVHAGVFLLLRLEPLLMHTPAVLTLIGVLGALTVLYGWLGGYVQTDVKSALLFATLTQVGLMFITIGLGGFEIAAWHAALHALWRGWQFLAVPSFLHMVDAPAAPAPKWLRGSQWLYTAVLQRFWLEALTDRLFTRPTLALARDMRNIDANVISRLVGMPESQRAAALLQEETVVKGRGLAGAMLESLAERLDHFEQHLVLQVGGGRIAAWLHRVGDWLKWMENLLEQPRYLLLLVMATMVVIL